MDRLSQSKAQNMYQADDSKTPKTVTPNTTLNYFVDGDMSVVNPQIAARRVPNFDIYEATEN